MVNKRSIIIGLSLISMICLYGCKESQESGDTTGESKPSINTFVADNNTISVKEEAEKFSKLPEDEMQAYREEIARLEKENSYLSELKITGEDNQIDYEVSGDDIIYNNRVFENLNACVDNMEYTLSRESMINMLVKSFDNNTDRVVCTISNDKVDRAVEEASILADPNYESTMTYLEDILYEFNGYSDIVNRHNGEKAFWMLSMESQNSVGHIYGSSTYMLCRSKQDITINLDELAEFKITEPGESMTENGSETGTESESGNEVESETESENESIENESETSTESEQVDGVE